MKANELSGVAAGVVCVIAVIGSVGCPTAQHPGPDGGGASDAGAVDGGPSDAGPSDAGSDAGTPYDAFCQSWTQALCTKMVTCGFWSSVPDCVAEKRAFFCQETGVSVALGFQHFDSLRAASCLSAIVGRATAAGNCPDFGGELLLGDTDCAQVATPLVGSGGACFQSSDCVDPNQGCAQSGCGQTCQTGGAPGQPCLFSFNFSYCNTGYCDSTNVCRAWVGTGSPCPTGFECDPSSTTCNNSGQCVALPGLNQSCVPQPYNTCAAAYFCDPVAMRCLANPTLGQPCSPLGTCAAGLWCDSGNTGTCLKLVAQGGSCNTATPQQCQSPLTCLGSTQTCQPARALGQACQLDTDCAISASFYESGGCDPVRLVCVVQSTVKAADPCNTWQRCPTGYRCVADGGVGTFCYAATLGAACTSRLDCPLSSTCSGNLCVATAVGTPCDQTNVCAAGSYCSTLGGTIAPTCAALATHGQPCELIQTGSYPNSCVAPDFCIPVTGSDAGTCGPLHDAGASCDSQATAMECQLPAFCFNGACQPAGHSGESCMQFGTPLCVGGSCQQDAGTFGTCRPLGQPGQPCDVYSDCASGACLGGNCQSCP
jgi:hypothetical protein